MKQILAMHVNMLTSICFFVVVNTTKLKIWFLAEI